MCGIIGYLGKSNGVKICLNGLKRLEYRGYDSAGIAVINNNKLQTIKTKGPVVILESKLKDQLLEGNLVIAHTRWATHGIPSEENAHPQFDCQKKIAVVHNGIIENYAVLKKWLSDHGHHFTSQTDTEVIAHLIEQYYNGDLVSTLEKVLPLLEGTYGLAIISTWEPAKLVAVKLGSPLLLGICSNGDLLVASDGAAVIEHTKNVIYLDDREIAILTQAGYQIVNFNKQKINKTIQEITPDLNQLEKGGFPHFMLKEIFSQPESLLNAIRGRINIENQAIKLGGLADYLNFLKQAKRLVLIGCGTSWHAGLIGEYLMENLATLPAEVEYASEFRYKGAVIDQDVPYFVISQSGETADTLESLRKIKNAGAKVFGIINVVGSTIAREAEAGIYLHAGPEIGVASTKAFTSQVAVLTILALFLARERGKITNEVLQQKMQILQKLPLIVQKILDEKEQIKIIAEKYVQFNNFLYLGRGYNYPVALEGALKLKEISYIHAEGYPAAEMKHGPIALIDQNMPVVVLATETEDIIYQKIISNIEEVKAREGKIIAISTISDQLIKKLADEVIEVPRVADFISPIVNVIPLQLLAYYLAVFRGCDVDKPRNLAKSVTVE